MVSIKVFKSNIEIKIILLNSLFETLQQYIDTIRDIHVVAFIDHRFLDSPFSHDGFEFLVIDRTTVVTVELFKEDVDFIVGEGIVHCLQQFHQLLAI